MSVKFAPRAPEVTYAITIDVSGADPVRKRFGKITFTPDQLSVTYRETASGWTVSSANIGGLQVTKSGAGKNRFSDRLWSSDEWPQWVREAIQTYAPRGGLR